MDSLAGREFRDYVAARQSALLRVALLLTGHREDAENRLQTALIKLALHWTRLTTTGSPDAYVRKILYHQQVNRWRRRGRRPEHVTAQPPDLDAIADPTGDSALRLTLERALGLRSVTSSHQPRPPRSRPPRPPALRSARTRAPMVAVEIR
jgi:DNA-directed RNA polymerase specialized sigma24 family protein